MKTKKPAPLERKKSKSKEKAKSKKNNIAEISTPKNNIKIDQNKESPKFLEQKNGLDTKVPEPEPKPTAPFKPPNTNTQPQSELEKIFKDANILKDYDFDLYKNLKGTLKLKDKQCKDGLTKNSYYCLECKIATCPNCPLFKIHNGHPLVEKYPYYCCDNKLLEDTFSELEFIFNENPSFLDSNLVKNELIEHVNNNMEKLFYKLTEVKIEKLNELNELFSYNEDYISNLKPK